MSEDQFGDAHFSVFASSLEALLSRHDMPDRKNLDTHQCGQIEDLVAAEIVFRNQLQKQKLGRKIYAGFIDYVRKERRNILAARPYFRERDSVFREKISGALAAGNPDGLYTYGINAIFIQFVLSKYGHRLNPTGPLIRYANKVLKIRSDIVEQNLPLAISKAKKFYSSTPKSPHMDRMDLMQVSSEGLISAVDKFVLPYTPRFRAVVIGRSTGNLIGNYSETLIHFYPGDRRKIYQANKARRKTQDLDKLVEIVNTNLPMELQTNADEIQQLMNASSHLSLDQPLTSSKDGREASTYSDYTIDAQALPDEVAERNDLHNKLLKSVSALSIYERKVLACMGMLSEGNL